MEHACLNRVQVQVNLKQRDNGKWIKVNSFITNANAIMPWMFGIHCIVVFLWKLSFVRGQLQVFYCSLNLRHWRIAMTEWQNHAHCKHNYAACCWTCKTLTHMDTVVLVGNHRTRPHVYPGFKGIVETYVLCYMCIT